ncbi:EAL domain-containing protein [Rhodoblastus sphagnicola]
MTLVIFGFIALIASVTSISIFGLKAVDAKMKFIEQVGLVETHYFAGLGDKLSEMRLMEVTVHHAENETERAETLEALAQSRETVGLLITQGDAIMPGRVNVELFDRFRAAWKHYAELHDRQFSTMNNRSHPGGVESLIHKAYVETEQALDLLDEASQNQITREVQDADALSDSIMTMMIVASVFATGAALLLYGRARKNLFTPLREITEALTALAQGRTDVELSHRQARDEIADLASAFRIFRANLAELEHAHSAAKLARKAAEAMAHQDPLTNLPNRRALAAKLRAFLQGDGEPAKVCALLIVDLDRFKPVNDLLGHMVGDLVLCEVAKRLEEAVVHGGLVARLGGDEFAAVMPLADGCDPQPARDLAKRIRDSLRAPIAVGDHRIEIDASIGIAVSDGASDPAGLLSAADIAMYSAKRSDQDRICLFKPEMEGALRRRVGLEKALRRALKAGEITPHYQPIVDLGARRIRGFEILARWRDPQLGQISPEIFIPLAEQQGLIFDLSMAMLAQACRDAADWPEDIGLSINVSPVQLRDRRFPEDLLASLRAHGFPPQRLEIEITETALIGDVDLVRDILVRLRAAGLKVSLDDFGMGFSSLNHLRQFKIDKVKIDKSFTKTIFEDPESALIVRSVLHLAHGLNLMTVAEGVEDERTADMMSLMGCDFGQGYHFGKAVPAAEAAALAARPAGQAVAAA